METNNAKPTKIKDLTINHTIQLEDGSWQKIISISNGMYSGSKLIIYENGLWSNLLWNHTTPAIYTEPIID